MNISEDLSLTLLTPLHHATRKEMRQKQLVAKKVEHHRLRTSLTMVAATGLLATSALPSYGFDPETTAMSGLARDNTMVEISAPSQGLSVAAVRAVEFSRGDYQPAEASEFEVRSSSRRYDGPTAADYVLDPRFTNVTSGNIMKASAELVGTPYVYGGETPAGFDCSGYVMFVYSQFGMDLPHSVYQQAKLGEKISLDEAIPGDIVVFNDYSHNGIYAGNGNFYHAPQPGDRVKLAPIFTDRYHIIRLADIDN
ncbi:C40 family peptidase [Aquiluna borgnonia]|uniref:C40 family peptidase n=1 Tax=Aquiluna borgnonia TaxID=2499157 RepID=A0A7D4QFM7_9MICO|nr:C40 family peptidase [Aquiluna borgnonia]